MRSPHTEPRREVWGSGAPSLPRSRHICVQESRPHTVRDPVTARGRDLRIGARAWAGAARRTALLLSGQGSPRVGPGPAVPNLDREPRNAPNGSRDRLSQSYHAPPSSASRQAPHVRRCKDSQPRAQRPATAVLGACHVTRAQRHARGFKAYSRPVRKPDFSAENQHLSPRSHRKPRNTLCRDMVFPPACSTCVKQLC